MAFKFLKLIFILGLVINNGNANDSDCCLPTNPRKVPLIGVVISGDSCPLSPRNKPSPCCGRGACNGYCCNCEGGCWEDPPPSPKCSYNVRVPTNCKDLACIGNTINGIYLVINDKKIGTVFCNFKKPNNDPGFEYRLGFIDVKPRS